MSDARNKYTTLISNTIIFALGTFGSKLLVFLLMPLYTSVLTTAEYGAMDVVVNVSNMLLPLVIVSINDGVIRFGMDHIYKRRDVFSTGIWVSLAGFGIFLICYFIMWFAVPAARSARQKLEMNGEKIPVQSSGEVTAATSRNDPDSKAKPIVAEAVSLFGKIVLILLTLTGKWFGDSPVVLRWTLGFTAAGAFFASSRGFGNILTHKGANANRIIEKTAF